LNRSHNFSKVGTGTVKNSYGSTTLQVTEAGNGHLVVAVAVDWLVDKWIDWLISVDWVIVVGGVTRRAHPSLPSESRGLSNRKIDRYRLDRKRGYIGISSLPPYILCNLELLFCFLVFVMYSRQVAKDDAVGRRLKGRECNPPPCPSPWASSVINDMGSLPWGGPTAL
jgi:hypothetical protein